jgi:hypothetical protein
MARFQSFWLGNTLPPCQMLCLKSFIDHGHEFDLYCYGTPAVPQGARVLDANEILPRSEVFFYGCGAGRGSVACFANLFRYRLLMMRGGWWVDMDVVCLSSRTLEGEIFLERQQEDLICNAVMKFPKGHIFANALYEKARAAGKDLEWGQTGPQLVTALAKQMGFWDQTEMQKDAYPIHWKEALLPVTVSGRSAAYDKTRSALMLHLWNEFFRRDGSLALHNPPDGSFLADLYIKHGVQRRYWALIGPYKLKKWRRKSRAFIGRLLKCTKHVAETRI